MLKMATLKFKDISFSKEKSKLLVTFYGLFFFEVSLEDFNSEFGETEIFSNSIEIPLNEEKASRKFNFFLLKNMGFLTNKLNGRRAVYIHRNSGIPLIGNISFGIVDRNSTLIEIKPITSCVLNCIYCSLSEGSEEKAVDFFVECEYLTEKAQEIVEFKGIKDIEFHINAQGEPMLYSRIVDLVEGLAQIDGVSRISMDTNGLMLDKKKIDALCLAGMTQFNVSLNAIAPSLAEKISGIKGYNIDKILENCRLIAKHKKLLLAPILLAGINELEIPKIIEFGKKLDAKIGVQNFLEYKGGNNPAKQLGWEKFYDLLKGYEKKHEVKLILEAQDFNIKKARELPNPFHVDETCEAEIICRGRYPNEAIAALRDRNITVITRKKSGKVRFKIARNKHNIILGKEV